MKRTIEYTVRDSMNRLITFAVTAHADDTNAAKDALATFEDCQGFSPLLTVEHIRKTYCTEAE